MEYFVYVISDRTDLKDQCPEDLLLVKITIAHNEISILFSTCEVFAAVKIRSAKRKT